MPNWEYKTKKIEKKGRGFDATFVGFLNDEGMHGWELCGIREFEKTITCIFKKVKDD